MLRSNNRLNWDVCFRKTQGNGHIRELEYVLARPSFSGNAVDLNTGQPINLTDRDMLEIYKTLQEMDKQAADLNKSRAKRFIESLREELKQLDRAAQLSGDETIWYSPEYIRAATVLKEIQ